MEKTKSPPRSKSKPVKAKAKPQNKGINIYCWTIWWLRMERDANTEVQGRGTGPSQFWEIFCLKIFLRVFRKENIMELGYRVMVLLTLTGKNNLLGMGPQAQQRGGNAVILRHMHFT